MTPITLREAWKLASLKELTYSDIIEKTENKCEKLFFDLDNFLRAKNDLPHVEFIDFLSVSVGWNRYDTKINSFVGSNTPVGVLQLLDCETVQHNEKHRSPFCACAYVMGLDYEVRLYVWLSDGEASLIPCKIPLTIAFSADYDASYLSNFYELNGDARYLDVLSLANLQYKFTDDQLDALRRMTNYGARLPWMDQGLFIDAEDGKGMSGYISLARLYKFFYQEVHAKDVRSDIIKSTWNEAIKKRFEFIKYNYTDIHATFKCFYLLFNRCKKTMPNPFSWLGMIEESSVLYRIEDDFHLWLDKCDSLYDKIKREMIAKLRSLAISYARSAPYEDFEDGLDWSVKLPKVQDFECFFQESIPEEWDDVYKSGQYKGCEKWVKKANDSKHIISYLIDSWLYSIDLYFEYQLKCSLPNFEWLKVWLKKLRIGDGITSIPAYIVCRSEFEGKRIYQERTDVNGRMLNRMFVDGQPMLEPKTNEEKGAIGLFGSGYDLWYKLGILSSPSRDLEYLRTLYTSLNHWGKLRERLHDLRVQNIDGKLWLKPPVSIAGAISGRQTSKLFHLQPKLGKDALKQIGIAYSGKVIAPDGYVMVHADFDAQEMRLQAIVSDLYTMQPESNEFSKAVLMGDKSKGTDSHTLMASRLGIARDNAKNFAFGSAYLSGADKLTTLSYPYMDLSHFKNRTLQDVHGQVRSQAADFLNNYRGVRRGNCYVGGVATPYFNKVIELANRNNPKSLILGATVPKHLDPANCGSEFLTTRVNIIIQGAGADLMKIYLTVVQLLAKSVDIEMHHTWSVHDAFCFLVKTEDKDKATQVMACSHLFAWIYAMRQMGFKQVTKEMLFFESIDIDNRWRKSPKQRCQTMDNPDGYPEFTLT